MGEGKDKDAIVQAHYTTEDIAGRIVAALRKVMGDEAPPTPDVLAQMDHFHGGGIASTRDLVAALQPEAASASSTLAAASAGRRAGSPAPSGAM